MIRLLRDSGFEIEDLVEVQIAEDATTPYPFVTPEWARRWPAKRSGKREALGPNIATRSNRHDLLRNDSTAEPVKSGNVRAA